MRVVDTFTPGIHASHVATVQSRDVLWMHRMPVSCAGCAATASIAGPQRGASNIMENSPLSPVDLHGLICTYKAFCMKTSLDLQVAALPIVDHAKLQMETGGIQ